MAEISQSQSTATSLVTYIYEAERACMHAWYRYVEGNEADETLYVTPIFQIVLYY